AVVLREWVRCHGWSFLAGRDTPYGTSFRYGYPRSTAGYRTARIAAGSGRPPSSDQVPSSTVNAGVFVDESPLFAGLISHRDSSPVLPGPAVQRRRSEEHTSELQSRFDLVCRLLLAKKKTI